MITEAIVSAVLGVIDMLVSLLPEVTFTFASTLTEFAELIGSQLGGLNNILPISEVAVPLGWALTVYLPFVVVFYIVRWVYSKIPVIGQ